MKGQIFDIKKFAVHDGPGIRSTLFLKGCPLKCLWCHNPEGIDGGSSLWWFERKCIGCGACLEACPRGALSRANGSGAILIDRELCDNCGACVEACPTRAMAFDGYELEADAAVERLMEDQIFYEQSGGGITVSGGDPVFQHKFARTVLEKCKARGAHTAIETSMFAKEEVLRSFIGLVDLFIVDIKIFDSQVHRRYTGVPNELILSNFKMLSGEGQKVLVRIPLIPTITATEDNLCAIAEFVAAVSPRTPIELINFNPLSESKYRLMGRDHKFLGEMKPFGGEELDRFYALLESRGAKIERETALPND